MAPFFSPSARGREAERRKIPNMKHYPPSPPRNKEAGVGISPEFSRTSVSKSRGKMKLFQLS